MKSHKNISRVFALVLLLAFAGAPQFALLRRANAQDRTINVNERIDLRALGIKNEVQQISSLGGALAKFFKRSSELQKRGIVSPRDASAFKNEGDQRKADLQTIKRELESLISKLKRANHWDAAFDAQVLASLKGADARSAVTQAGGARKLFEVAVTIDENGIAQQDIIDEVRQVESKKQGALGNRSDRVFTAHARPMPGKVGCNLLLSLAVSAYLFGANGIACDLVELYNKKGCTPKFAC